jgi:hypothetical protein
VDVNPDDERAWYEDAYRVLSKPAIVAGANSPATNETAQASTNRPSRRRMNEAELVRMLREGQSPEDVTNVTVRDGEPGRSIVRDPALARAIDLLKGLSVVQRFKSR